MIRSTGSILSGAILAGASVLLVAVGARADDLKLKDGSKITGTIVGFDDSSFKVQTSYGFALVRKDQVVSITISDSAKSAAASDKKPDAQSAKKEQPSDAADAKTASADKPQPLSGAPANVIEPAPASAPVARTASGKPAVPPPAVTPSAPPAPVVAAAPPPPKPEPVREEVDGNTYVNQTYGFRMYKPPAWQVIAGAQSFLPGAIAAMGTSDQTTYLLIGQQSAGKSLANEMDATDQRLRGVMGNFRPLGESKLNVSGTQAIERKFRGSVDQKDWSGTVVVFARGGETYTIFGMTVADTDLVQIQENVIARAISSLQFIQ